VNLWAHKPISLTLFIILLFTAIPVHTQAESVIAGYPDYSEIEQRLEDMNSTYPGLCSLKDIGRTYEGRVIWALKISDNPRTEEYEEPDILIMGEHHAKELISAMVPLLFAESLLQNYSSDREVKTIVDSNEIWIVPVVNPDGYEYVINGHTDWRKNRRPIDTDADGIIDGIGVDLNRNYAHHWGEAGISRDPTSDIYCGPYAFSENETRAIRNLVLSHDFVFSVSFHSYGQIIYHPWGNALDPEPMDSEVMEAIAGRTSGYNLYRVMEGKDAYTTTGDSDDWMYANTTCLPFTIELGKEFIPPPSEIWPIFLRNNGALLYLLSISSNPYLAISEEKTNLRITNMSVSRNIAGIWVENQGNYSVSAELRIVSDTDVNSTEFLLEAHERKEVFLNIAGEGSFGASVRPLRHAVEWNETDNYAVYEYPSEESSALRVFPSWTVTATTIIVILGVAAYLFYLFKKNKLH